MRSDVRRQVLGPEERFVRNPASVSEKVDAGRLPAPRTRRGLLARSATSAIAPVLTPLIRPASAIALEDHAADAPRS